MNDILKADKKTYLWFIKSGHHVDNIQDLYTNRMQKNKEKNNKRFFYMITEEINNDFIIKRFFFVLFQKIKKYFDVKNK